MYNTNTTANLNFNKSVKSTLLIRIVILLIISTISSYFIVEVARIDGKILGQIIFPLFIVAEIPILFNYFFLILNKFGMATKGFSRILGKTNVFGWVYTIGLIFHSGLYTIVLGLVATHMLQLLQQSTYCVILMFVLGLIWLIEYSFWIVSWPLYPKSRSKLTLLYWLHWSLIFGLMIGLPFHVGNWNLFGMIFISLITFGSLFVLITSELWNIYSRQSTSDYDSQGVQRQVEGEELK